MSTTVIARGDVQALTWLDGLEHSEDVWDQWREGFQSVVACYQCDNRDRLPGKVLLVAQVLVSRDEDIELLGRQGPTTPHS